VPANRAQDEFPGLIPLVGPSHNSVNIAVDTRCRHAASLDLIRKRAGGRLWSGSKRIREFARKYPEYQGDDSASENIVNDLSEVVWEIEKRHCRKK